MLRNVTVGIAIVLLSAVVACSPQNPVGKQSSQNGVGSKYLLASEPSAPVDIIDARQASKDGDSVVVVGRIGGSVNPWIDGLAAFTIVDTSLKACNDIPGDKCPKPWDYCCETDKLPSATALVKFVDEQDKVLAVDARELLNVAELNTVVVRGKTRRDESGRFTIHADGLFVRN